MPADLAAESFSDDCDDANPSIGSPNYGVYILDQDGDGYVNDDANLISSPVCEELPTGYVLVGRQDDDTDDKNPEEPKESIENSLKFLERKGYVVRPKVEKGKKAPTIWDFVNNGSTVSTVSIIGYTDFASVDDDKRHPLIQTLYFEGTAKVSRGAFHVNKWAVTLNMSKEICLPKDAIDSSRIKEDGTYSEKVLINEDFKVVSSPNDAVDLVEKNYVPAPAGTWHFTSKLNALPGLREISGEIPGGTACFVEVKAE